MYEVRFYFNSKQYEVLGTYHTPQLAYGMRKKFTFQPQYPINKLKVVKL